MLYKRIFKKVRPYLNCWCSNENFKNKTHYENPNILTLKALNNSEQMLCQSVSSFTLSSEWYL